MQVGIRGEGSILTKGFLAEVDLIFPVYRWSDFGHSGFLVIWVLAHLDHHMFAALVGVDIVGPTHIIELVSLGSEIWTEEVSWIGV